MEKRALHDLRWRESTPGHFTGKVSMAELNVPVSDGPRVLVVDFEPGARTNWHSHSGGQVLHVLSGEGFVCNEDGQRVEIRAGDVITIPPGETHWHGAGPASPMRHLLVTDAPANWTGRDVTDSDYSSTEAASQ